MIHPSTLRYYLCGLFANAVPVSRVTQIQDVYGLFGRSFPEVYDEKPNEDPTTIVTPVASAAPSRNPSPVGVYGYTVCPSIPVSGVHMCVCKLIAESFSAVPTHHDPFVMFSYRYDGFGHIVRG